MPISSVENHHRTINAFHFQKRKNEYNSRSKNDGQLLSNDGRLSSTPYPEEGRVLYQLSHAANITPSGGQIHTHPQKQLQAGAFLNIALLLLSLKDGHKIRNMNPPLNGTSLAPGLPAQPAVNGSELLPAVVFNDMPVESAAASVRRKRTTGCTCEVSNELKKEKRLKARNKAKARAKARAETRAEIRAEARAAVGAETLASVGSEGTGSTFHLLGSATKPLATSVIKMAGAGLGTVSGIGAGTVMAGSVLSGDGAQRGKHAAGSTDTSGRRQDRKSSLAVGEVKTPSDKKGARHTDIMIDQSVQAKDTEQMRPYEIPDAGPSHPLQEADISNIPRLTQFIRPMNYYRWLFQHAKVDTLSEIRENVERNYKTNDVFLHHFKDADSTIPDRFHFLKNNIHAFRDEINKAHHLVNEALRKFRRTTLRNDHGYLQYPPKNSIRVYLKGALGTDNESIIYQAMLRLEYYLLQLEKYFNEYKGNVVFATAKQASGTAGNTQNSPMGFTMPMDSDNRIVLMVDCFEGDAALNNRLHITALHEATHIQAGSRDFVYAPIIRNVGDASEILEVFNEAMYLNGNEAIACDELFIQSYENFLDVNVSAAQFIQLIKNDPMLQGNIMMDNADSIAHYIYDIALSRAYNHDYLSSARNTRDTGIKHGALFIKTILNLLMKQGGIA